MTGPEFDPGFEGPSEADLDRFGGDDRACPECGTDVYADAPFCHACGVALEDEFGSTRAGGRRSLYAVGGLVGLVAFVAVIILV